MKIGKEDIIQIQICEWLKQTTDLPYYHYAGERKCTPQYGSMLKRKGTKPGVSDLHFPRPNDTFKDLWIELKAPGGKVTEAQTQFLHDRMTEGSCCHICYSSNEAIGVIKSFYGME